MRFLRSSAPNFQDRGGFLRSSEPKVEERGFIEDGRFFEGGGFFGDEGVDASKIGKGFFNLPAPNEEYSLSPIFETKIASKIAIGSAVFRAGRFV